MKWVRNPSTGKSLFVACGRCKACRQQVANRRARRIKNAYKLGYVTLLVTLTYDHRFIPYIRKSEIESYLMNKENSDDADCFISLYRDWYSRACRKHDGRLSFRQWYEPHELRWEVFTIRDLRDFLDSDPKRCRIRLSDGSFIEDDDKISVPYYKDVQDFQKRLSITLKRQYNYDEKLQYFQVNELGPTTLRSHFHLVVTCPKDRIKMFKDAVNTCWSYDGYSARLQKCKVVRDAAKYVASYVNRSSNFPVLFTKRSISPKCSFSKNLSMDNEHFTLPKVLEKIRNRNLKYPVKVFEQTASERLVNLPLPKYVVNRFFPKFKGYSKLTSNEIYQCVRYPWCMSEYIGKTLMTSYDLKVWSNLLSNKRDYFYKTLDMKDDDGHSFAKFFVDAWHLYDLQSLRFFYENEERIPDYELYDNIKELDVGKVHSDLYQKFVRDKVFPLDPGRGNPNMFRFRQLQTQYYEDEFNRRLKRKKENNIIMHDGFSINV